MSFWFKIHRGTKEIGGSCVEIWTLNTKIIIDFGMPLVDAQGDEFDFTGFHDLPTAELIRLGVLPDITGLYHGSDKMADGVIISHSHQDHYGLISYIDKQVQFYLGEATHKLIELNNQFTNQNIHLSRTHYFQSSKPFTIGDFTITPFLNDHSAFDAYSFLVESGGKSLFYSGDFRSHGRKGRAFRWFIHNAPKNVDYLLLEGTSVTRETITYKSENDIEKELRNAFKQSDKINLIYTSGQNIDRLTSIYKACRKSGKTLVVDVYVAAVLKTLSAYGNIPFPSEKFKDLKVIYPYYTSRRLKNNGNPDVLYRFKEYKITKQQITENHNNIVMVVRPSMQKDLEHIKGIDGGNLIYSLWTGYLQKTETRKFIDYLINDRGFHMVEIHTSGHADTSALKDYVKAIQPRNIVPIHTFGGQDYQYIFQESIVMLKDGDVIKV